PSPLPPDLERVQRRRVAEEEVALEQDLLGADGIRGCCAIDRIREPLARTGGERRRKIDQRARRLSHRAAPAAPPAAPDRPPRLACSGSPVRRVAAVRRTPPPKGGPAREAFRLAPNPPRAAPHPPP